MSESDSNLFEGISSFRGGLPSIKKARTKEEELVNTLNYFRFKPKLLLDTLKSIKEKRYKSEEGKIVFEEISRSITNLTPEDFEKLIGYVQDVVENHIILPDLSSSPILNLVLSKVFASHITENKSLFTHSQDTQQRLTKLLPSTSYQGIFVPSVDLNNFEVLLVYLFIEEYLQLNNQRRGTPESSTTVPAFEYLGEEAVQQISLLNGFLNTALIYVSEKREEGLPNIADVYILLLSDVVENVESSALVQNLIKFEASDNSSIKKKTRGMKYRNSGEFGAGMTAGSSMKSVIPSKYFQVSSTNKPDFTKDIVASFIKKLDRNKDDMFDAEDLIHFCRKNNLIYENQQLYDMIKEIEDKRQVKFEADRHKPIDQNELFNHIRLKYQKGKNGWEERCTKSREVWLAIFHVAGEKLPNNKIPPPKILPITAQYQMEFNQSAKSTTLPSIKTLSSSITVTDLKPKCYNQPFIPEAGLIIQNTKNITELYNEEPRAEERKPSAFEQVVNLKFKDVSQSTNFETVSFNTKAYYSEALRLSMNPQAYQNKEINPIYKYLPYNPEFVPESRKQSPQSQFVPQSRGFNKEDQSLSNDNENISEYLSDEHHKIDPVELKKMRSSRYGSVVSLRKTLSKNLERLESRELTKAMRSLPNIKSALLQAEKQSPVKGKRDPNERPLFYTRIKIPDTFTLRMEAAKRDPKGPYQPPQLHMFREDDPPLGKPLFKVASKAKVFASLNEAIKQDVPVQISEKQYLKMMREEQLMKQLDEKMAKQKPWIRYFKLAPRERGFVDHKYPQYMEKGEYTEPMLAINDLLRGAVEYDTPFILNYRTLRTSDKNMFLGEQIAPSDA